MSLPFIARRTSYGALLLTVDLEACQGEEGCGEGSASPSWQAFLHHLGEAYWQVAHWDQPSASIAAHHNPGGLIIPHE